MTTTPKPMTTRVREALTRPHTDNQLAELEADLIAHDHEIDRSRRADGTLDAASVVSGLQIEAVQALRRGDRAAAEERWNRMMGVSIAAHGGPEEYVNLRERAAKSIALAKQTLREREDRG